MASNSALKLPAPNPYIKEKDRPIQLSLEQNNNDPHLMIVALDNFQKYRRPILHRFGEYLQQVAILVVIHQDLQFLFFGERRG